VSLLFVAKEGADESRIPANCAFSTQHSDPELAQIKGAPATAGLAMPNGGLQVVNPSKDVYDLIVAKLSSQDIASYEFADQSLLSDAFAGRWMPLPYIYNALKTLRWTNVHAMIWEDDQVKNIHYILSPKPWDVEDENNKDYLHQWWRQMNGHRKQEEQERGVADQF
jgi:hypothetical protein